MRHRDRMRGLALGVCLLSFAAGARADESARDPLHWTLQVDPLTTAIGFVHLQVERTIGDHASVYLGPHFRLFSPPFGDPEDFYGYGAEIGVRWYVTGSAPRGWWVLLRGVGAYLTSDDSAGPGGYVSLLGGYTHVFCGGFLLSGGLGVQYLHYTIDGMGPSGVLPAAHTTLGYAF